MENKIIISHVELATHIKGKSVLHLNSFGKDCAVTLDWLVNFAKVKIVVSLNLAFMWKHPDNDLYLAYQKLRYPKVEFISTPDPMDLNCIAAGHFQAPEMKLLVTNHFEHYDFSTNKVIQEKKDEFGLDYICMGHSKYESMDRAMSFHKEGILVGDRIFPVGMFTKKELIETIKKSGLKIHPCYKFSKGTYDAASYYKMRSAFIANPEFKKNVLRAYPLLALDEYRYEVLLKDSMKGKK